MPRIIKYHNKSVRVCLAGPDPTPFIPYRFGYPYLDTLFTYSMEAYPH